MAVTYEIKGGLTHLSGNPIEIVLMADEVRDNHKLVLKVTCKSMYNVELQGSPFPEEVAPYNLQATFDISALTDYPADYGFAFPIGGGANPHDLLATKVTFQYGETWTDVNGDLQESWSTAAETLKVLKGKMHQYELSLLNEAGKSFSSEYIVGGKFLTHMPAVQTMSADMLGTVWFLGQWPDEHVIHQNMKVKTNMREFTLIHNATIYSITGLMELNFSADFWAFYDFLPGEKIYQYEFWITDDSNPVFESEHRFFNIDYNYYDQSEIVYCVNPLSGIDRHWFRGSVKQGLSVTSETAVRPVSIDAGTQQATIKTNSVKGQRTWEINYGYRISKEDMLALRDLLETTQAWIVDKDNNKLIPVYVESGDFELYNSLQDAQEISIKLREAHND